jgi:hypothetical protein
MSPDTITAAINDLEQKERQTRQDYERDLKLCNAAWESWRVWLQLVQEQT